MVTAVSVSGAEPVTLAEAKVSARVDDDLGSASSLDGLIGQLISTARQQAEQLTGRCYRPQVLRVELSEWPAAGDVLPVHRPSACELSYWTGGGLTVLAAGAYEYASGGPGDTGTVLAPALGSAWPALAARAVGPRVRVDLSVGPASPDDVPACVKTYITASVCAWLKTPEATAAAALGPHPLFAGLLHGENLFA